MGRMGKLFNFTESKIDYDTVNLIKSLSPKAFTKTDLAMEMFKEQGFIEISPTEMTNWNFPQTIDGKWTDSQEPKSDGTYDHMGHNSSDVQAFYKVRWWQKRHWDTLPDRFENYFEGIKEFVIDGFFKRITKHPKFALGLIWKYLFKYHPFEVELSGWVWVADSLSATLKSGSYDLADDIISQKLGFEDSTDMYFKKKKINDPKIVNKMAEELLQDPERILEYEIKKNELLQVSEHMWVSQSDPTVFILNEQLIPFDLRDGWSPQKLTAVIAYWYRVFYNTSVVITVRKDEE